MKRIKSILAGVIMGLAITSGFSQAGLDYYLPQGEYLPGVPSPESVFGYQVGEWHISHDMLVFYLKQLAETSDRVICQEYARTYENRPLIHLIITSAENHRNLEKIRTEHLKLSDPGQSADIDVQPMPVVVRLGYGVHGNESSSTNASVLVAYYLAASTSEQVSQTLENSVILIDPSLNPDGFNRHASWVNMHKSKVPMKDDNSRGFNETWPGGRTNHYWFDLNRDWLLLQHPESRGRVEVFHNWKPNVQTDHHEMGSSSSFFFQPGIPSRTNPQTPQSTINLTRDIGLYHAEALDGIGSLFFTEEIYDDYYYGKGSSYPDVNGSIGILFEQAGSRGYERNTPLGMLSFPYAIRNQVTVSVSTLKASLDLRVKLLEHQKSFYKETESLYASSSEKGYVFGENNDAASLSAMLQVLLQHRIEVYQLKKSYMSGGISYTPSNAYLIPLKQPQYRMIQSLFQALTSFKDSLFYDVSAWTLPMAYNIPYAAVISDKSVAELKGEMITASDTMQPAEFTIGKPSDVGYVFHWNDYFAPRALYSIQEAGLLTQVATRPIGYKNQQINQSFSFGSIFIPVQKQDKNPEQIHAILSSAASEAGISIYPVSTSYTVDGMDMGSGLFVPLNKPNILLLTGDGVRSQEAGEVWHLLDWRMEIPLVLIDVEQLNSMDLSGYTHLIMPSGDYDRILAAGKQEIERWLKRGGTIVAINSANQWLAKNKLADLSFKVLKPDSSGFKSYSDLSNAKGARRISGCIFEAEVDISHPIAYGLTRNSIPVFRSSTLIANPLSRPYAVPLRYVEDPLLSGYVPASIYENLRNTPGIIISSRDSGRIVSFIDNPNFRGFWYGTNKLFLNAIFFGPIISSDSSR